MKFCLKHLSDYTGLIAIKRELSLYKSTPFEIVKNLGHFVDDKARDSKTEIHFGKSRIYFGKRRKCLSLAFSPLPTMFSKCCNK